MKRIRAISLGLSCLLLVGGLSACGKKAENVNTSNLNTAAVITKPSPGLLLSISPAKGPAAGGTQVKVTGEGFTGTPALLFGTKEATEVSVVSTTEISAKTPAGTKGDDVDITLRAPNAPTSTLVDGFHYE
jgi:hypothetical protein